LNSAPSGLAHSADLKVRQFSGRELVILDWRSIADAFIDPFLPYNQQGSIGIQIGVLEGISVVENSSLTISTTKQS
jgi:hypothetical protein